LPTPSFLRSAFFRLDGRAILWVLLVLILGLSASLYGASRMDKTNARQAVANLNEHFDTVSRELTQRFSVYENGLTDLRAAISSMEVLRAGEFDTLIRLMSREGRFKGAVGFGLAVPVPEGGEAEFLKRVAEEGEPDFKIMTSPTHRGDRYIVRHFHAISADWTAKGWDMATSEDRRQAAQRAARSGKSELSAPVTLVRDYGTDIKSFLLYLPLYKTSLIPTTAREREAALESWIYAPLTVEGILGTEIYDTRLFHLTIKDITPGGPETTFYDSSGSAVDDPKIMLQQREINMYGRRWLLEFSANPAYVDTLNQPKPWITFAIGALITLLTAALLAAVINAWRQGLSVRLAEKDVMVSELMANLSAGVIQISGTSEVLYANPRALKMLGVTERELMGLSLIDANLDLVDENGIALDRMGRERLRTSVTGVPLQNLVLGLRSPGTLGVRWLLLNASPRIGASGTVTRVDLSFIDISAQVNARQSLDKALGDLKQAHAMLARTEMIAQTGGWSIDYATGETTWTPASYLIHDVEPGDHEGLKAYLARMRASRAPGFAAMLAEAQQNARTYEIEYECVTATGRKIWVRTYGEPVMRNGEVVGAAGYFKDITERKEAELRTEYTLETLERTETIARIGGWEYEIESDTMTWTSGMYRIYEIEPGDEYAKDTFYRQILENADLEYQRKFEAAIAHGTPYELLTETATARGRKIWLSSRGTPVIEDGKVVKIVGHAQDITDQKETEARLRAAQKMEAIGQLTGGIAHDFNNLLTVLVSNLELIRDEPEVTPFMSARIAAAMRATDRGAHLTKHLLAFGRNQSLAPRRVDLRDVATRTAGLLKRTLPSHISIGVEAPASAVFADVDESQLENALVNLGLNARDAMPKGGDLTLKIYAIALAASDIADGEKIPAGNYAVIEVKDTGCGMTEAVKTRAFDPFFTTKPFGQATGLGLSMVYGFARQSGGFVQLETAPGRGASFALHFPLVGAEGLITQAAPVGEASPAAPRNVLLVEDMPDVREAISAQLHGLGFNVTTAHDGPSALNTLERMAKVDILITDLGLPGFLNGDKLADEIERRRPGIKILTMSGYGRAHLGDTTDHDEARRPYLRKPFSRNDLRKALDEIIVGA